MSGPTLPPHSDLHDAVTAFLDAVQDQDLERARRALQSEPRIARESVHVAAVLGRTDDVARLVASAPTLIASHVGRFGGDPLLYLCHSPFHGENAERDAGLVASARLLLAAGADPNTRDAVYGVPALFAVTGQRSVLPIARLLLDAGANPTDGESLHHAAERFHEDALELLLAAGADLNGNDNPWGNTPLHFLVRWHDLDREERTRRGAEWLLEHGANPNVRCAPERETALHLAARIGQTASVIRLLVAHGADVRATRGDGRTAWQLAARGGFDEVARALEAAGSPTEPLSPLDLLLAACGRGDAAAASVLSTPTLIDTMDAEDRRLLPHAAAMMRDATVHACIAAGMPVDALDESGATALHFAALHGRADLLGALLAAGARFDIADAEHASSALGWTCWAADFLRDERGDYPATVRALADAGATFIGEEHRPRDAAVRAELQRTGMM